MIAMLSTGCLLLLPAVAAERPAYALFTSDGRPTDYGELLNRCLGADVILFGEQHDNPLCHWLEQSLASDLAAAQPGRLVLGAEVLETDDQLKVDELLAGVIRVKDFLAEAKTWDNHAADYQPLVDLAARSGLRFVATNIPRRYAALVSRDGLSALESLSDEARRFLPPLPIPVDLSLPGYQQLVTMAAEGHGGVKGENLAAAQAVKDATMAWSIRRHLRAGERFLHVNGSYHGERREGIVWYLKQSSPNLSVLTIATRDQTALTALDQDAVGLADVVLVTPTGFPTGHAPKR